MSERTWSLNTGYPAKKTFTTVWNDGTPYETPIGTTLFIRDGVLGRFAVDAGDRNFYFTLSESEIPEFLDIS